MLNVDLIQTVLEKGATFSGQITGISSEIDEILQSVSLQHFTKPQIDKISSELSKKHLYDVLHDFKFTFSYHPQLLDNICSIKISSLNEIEYLSCVILYSYIAFISQLENQKKFPEVLPLFKSFVNISFKSQNLHDISGKCFNHIYQLLINYGPNSEIYSYLDYYLAYAKIFSCPKLTIQIFDHLFELDQKFYNFLDSLADILRLHPDFFDEQHEDNYSLNSSISSHDFFTHIIEPLIPLISQFEPSSVKLFQSINNMTDEIAMTIFPHFAQSILFDAANSKTIQIEPPQENESGHLYFKIPKNIQLFLNFPKKPTFSCQFDPSQTITFPRQVDLKSLLNSSLIEKLQQIEIMTKSDSRIIEIFLSSLFANLHFQEKSNFFYNIIATILYFSNQLYENLPGTFSISTELSLSFFHPRIFDSSVTIFDENDDFELVNTFRSISLDWICLDNGDALNQLLNIYFISYPLLLAELLYRLVGMTSVIISKIGSFPKLIESFRKIAVVYQEFDRNCDENDTIRLSSIQKVRVSLFTLFAHLFTNESILKKFFLYSPDHFYLSCENSFTSAYLSFLFEDRIRPYIITSIRNFFVNNKQLESNDVDAIASIFNVIMAKATMMLPGEEEMMMIKDFFGMLNEIILYNQLTFSNHFKDLCPILCSSLPKLTNCELAKQVFEVSITFFTLMSSCFEIKNLEIDAILSCLVMFNDIEFVDSLYTKFIQLLAGERLLSIKPLFIVKQPQIIKIFIQILFQTPKIQEVLVFFYDLLQFSPINLQRCANCDLDIYILEFLEKEKVEEKLDTEVIQKVLSTYSLLSSRHSTTQAVLRFISLLSPIDETHVSKYEPLFFTALENIITTVYKMPEYVLLMTRSKRLMIDLISSDSQLNYTPENHSIYNWNSNLQLDNEPIMIISNIDTNELKIGFSLAFWIRVEPSESTQKVFSIFFGKNVLLSLSISNTSVFFSQDDSITQSVYKMTESFPLHTWQFVLLSFIFQKARSRVFFDINCVEEASSTFPLMKMEPDFSEVTIILNDNDYIDIESDQHVTQIGPFGLFPPLSPENQVLVREMGVRPRISPPIPFYVFFLNEKNYVKNDENDFIDILISKSSIDTLMPIFKLRNYKTVDGNDFDFQMEYGFILLNKILLFTDAAQKKFQDCNGFNILCQLIIDYWLDKFNMKLYTNLVSILQSLTNENLQVQLFDSILVYFPFLMKLKPHLHEKILRNLSQSLFISFKNIAVKCRGFGVILSALRKFYYYSPTELTIIYQPKNRPVDLNIQQCRSFLFEILYTFASDKFTFDYFQCVVSHCISCTELLQILDMLSFLLRVFSELSESVQFDLENETFSFLIFFFIRYPNEKFQYLIISMIDKCLSNKLISDKFFNTHITEIIKMIPESAMNKDMLKFVIEKFNENPLFMPLACFFVIHFKDDELLPFINSLNPSEKYVNGEFWAIWPLFLTLYCSAEDSIKVILFLFQCDPSKILDIYAQFDAVFELHPKQRIVIENCFSTVLSHLFIFASNAPSIKDYLELSKRIIFFGHKNEQSAFELLNTIFNTDSKNSNEIESDSKSGFAPQKIFDNVTSTCSFNDLFDFKVSYSSFQCWSHVNLALSCIEKFSEETVENQIEYGFFDLVLCAFLQEYGIDNSFTNLFKLEVSLNEIQNVDLAVQLLYYHSVMADQDEQDRLSNSSGANQEHHGMSTLLTTSPAFSSFSFNLTSPLLNQQKYEIFKNELQPKRYIEVLEMKLNSLHGSHSYLDELDQIIPNSDINKYVSISMDQLLKFDSQETRKEEEMKKEWKRLWTALTVERAPWCMTCSVKNDWKRDSSLCTSLMTPLKMIRMQQVDLIENSMNEKETKFILDVECIQITPADRKQAIFSLSEKAAYLTVDEVKSTLFTFENIKYLFWQQNNGLLFITSQGISHLLEFANEDDKKSIISFFQSHKNIIFDVLQNLPPKDFFYTTSFQRKWLKWKLTNYQYLIYLNFLSGRSFHDIDFYPVMPWVLTDYGADEIKEETVRDLKEKSYDNFPLNKKYVLNLLKFIEPFKSLLNNNEDLIIQSDFNGIESIFNSSNHFFNQELIPEFFSMPEVVEDENFRLPKWSKSGLDFVYNHRKLLESDSISRSLHEWISSIWSRSRNSPFPLFDGIHPMRNILVKNSLLDDVYDFDMTGINRLSCAGFSDKTGNKTMTLFALVTNGIVFSYKFSSSKRKKTFSMDSTLPLSAASSKAKIYKTSNPQLNSNSEISSPSSSTSSAVTFSSTPSVDSKKSHQQHQKKIHSVSSAPSVTSKVDEKNSHQIIASKEHSQNDLVHQKTELILLKMNKYDFPSIQFDKSHSLPNGKFVILDKKENKVGIVGKKLQYLETQQLNQITCIASDDIWIAIGGDSMVNLFKNFKFFCSIQLYRDLILTVGISSTFNAVVGGTKDGSLIICSTLHGSMVKVIEMKKMVPVKIIISPSWGFILSYYQSIVLGAIKHFLFVHTINGEFVREIEIQFAVEDWICWSSSGFDYVLMLANDGEIFYAEVYFLQLHKVFKCAKMQVVSLAYSPIINCAVVTQASGNTLFIPLVVK